MYITRYKKILFNNIVRILKTFILANYAKSVPPISVILSYYKVKIIKFCDAFNKETKEKFLNKLPLKVTIYIYKDKSCRYITEYPSINFLIKNLLKFKKKKIISYLDIYKLALIKQLDNISISIFSLIKTVVATIFSMNIKINK